MEKSMRYICLVMIIALICSQTCATNTVNNNSSDIFDFRYQNKKFNLHNAYLLAKICKLSYESSDVINSRMNDWNLKYKIIKEDTDIDDSNKCIIAYNDYYIIMVFEGVPLRQYKKVRKLSKLDNRPGYVDSVFYDSLNNMKSRINERIEEIRTASQSIWITGHGLGGASALLASSEIRNIKDFIGLYTFGQPRIGDKEFASEMGNKYHRFVNNNDPVANFPKFESDDDDDDATKGREYFHAGRYYYKLSRKGKISGLPTDDFSNESNPFSEDMFKHAEHDINEYIDKIKGNLLPNPTPNPNPTPSVSSEYKPKNNDVVSTCEYKGKLYVFHDEKFDKNVWYQYFDGNKWSKDTKLDKLMIGEVLNAVTYNNKLYLFYNGKDGSNIYYKHYDGSRWSDQTLLDKCTKIKDISTVIHKDKLYIFYNRKDETGIWHKYYDNQKEAWSKSFKNDL